MLKIVFLPYLQHVYLKNTEIISHLYQLMPIFKVKDNQEGNMPVLLLMKDEWFIGKIPWIARFDSFQG